MALGSGSTGGGGSARISKLSGSGVLVAGSVTSGMMRLVSATLTANVAVGDAVTVLLGVALAVTDGGKGEEVGV